MDRTYCVLVPRLQDYGEMHGCKQQLRSSKDVTVRYMLAEMSELKTRMSVYLLLGEYDDQQ